MARILRLLSTIRFLLLITTIFFMTHVLQFVTSDTPPTDGRNCTTIKSCQECTSAIGCGWCPIENDPYCIPTNMSGPLPGFTCRTEIRYKTCLVSLAAIWVGLIVVVAVLAIVIPLGVYCYRRRMEIAERLRSTGAERNLNAMASKFRAKYGRSERKGWINI